MSAVRKVNEESLAEAASVIAGGGLVVIPTDTVYGVACDPRNEAAIDRIYQVKSRPRFKALQVLLASVDQLDGLGLDLPSPLNRLAAQFLPGAFSRRSRWPARTARSPRSVPPRRAGVRRASACRIRP